VVGKADMYDQLALRRVTGNVTFARGVLRQNNASRWKATNFAIARLEFDLA
jgi:hypothetical protein